MYCHKPDRVPLAELPFIDKSIKETYLGKSINDIKTDIEFWQKAGYDYYPISITPNFNPENLQWNQEHKGIITTIRDFEEYPWPKPENTDYSGLEEAAKYLPDEMEIVVSTGGFFYYVWNMMGFQEFSYAVVDNPLLIEKMFKKVGSLLFDTARNMMDFDRVGALWICSDIAYTEGLMVSPSILRKHFFPWFKKMGDICREKDIPFIYHSDGNLWEVMDDIIECGINAIHPVEPKSMDAKELKEKVGDKICLIGNIDVDRLCRGTPEEIDLMVKDRIKTLGSEGGYCVGSSNTITRYVNFENYKAMISAVFKYGKYSIDK